MRERKSNEVKKEEAERYTRREKERDKIWISHKDIYRFYSHLLRANAYTMSEFIRTIDIHTCVWYNMQRLTHCILFSWDAHFSLIRYCWYNILDYNILVKNVHNTYNVQVLRRRCYFRACPLYLSVPYTIHLRNSSHFAAIVALVLQDIEMLRSSYQVNVVKPTYKAWRVS